MKVVLKGQPFAIAPLLGKDIRSRHEPSDRQLADLTTVAWGKPGGLLQDWLSLADVMLVATQNGMLRGFTMGKLLQPDVLLFSVAVVHPDTRRLGLATYLSMSVVWLAWRLRAVNSGWRFWQAARVLYLTFRTPNPVLYSSVARRVRVTPSPDGRQASRRETEIAALVARAFGGEDSFDRATFVARGALLPYPDLVYRPGQIPWCDDDSTNEFFREVVELDEVRGNELVVVGKAPTMRVLIYLLSRQLFG